MKIKTKQKLNLPELIQYVWENEVYPCRYVNNFNGEVVFNDIGKFMTDESFISPSSYFTVEDEEELTEDTVINGLADVFYDPLVDGINVEFYADCIKNIKQDAMETYSVAIFYKDTLVWTKEHGIPESGVLEVEG